MKKDFSFLEVKTASKSFSVTKRTMTLVLVVISNILSQGCNKLEPQSPHINQLSQVTMGLQAAAKVILKPVNLGSAISFTILAETGISTTGKTLIKGDIGISPLSSTAITGFGLVLSSDKSYSKSALISGFVFAQNYARTTPMKMVNALNDMKTAFNNGNALAPTQPLNLFTGNLSGQNLLPGVYRWKAGLVLGNSSTVTLTGSPTDIYVFQIGTSLQIGNKATVNLGKVLPSNVFWIVGGAAVIGTNARFGGIILAKSSVSLNTGDLINGKLFAQKSVSMNSATITGPPVPKPISIIGQKMASLPIIFNNYGMSIKPGAIVYYIGETAGQYSLQSKSKNDTKKVKIHSAGNEYVMIENADNHGVMTVGMRKSISILLIHDNGSEDVSSETNLFKLTPLGKGLFTLQDRSGNYVEISADLQGLTLRNSGHANEMNRITLTSL